MLSSANRQSKATCYSGVLYTLLASQFAFADNLSKQAELVNESACHKSISNDKRHIAIRNYGIVELDLTTHSDSLIRVKCSHDENTLVIHINK